MAFRRNLSAGEILDQALHFRRLEPIDHVVFMGMGEPMLNLDAVLAAARRLPELGVTHRRTTISTVGWLPGLRRFVDEVDEPLRLALSLHAPERRAAQPADARQRPLSARARCWPSAAATPSATARRVYVEYVLLAGVNDSPRAGRRARRLLDPELYKVNLIPYNPTGSGSGGALLATSSREATARFKRPARARARSRRRCG